MYHIFRIQTSRGQEAKGGFGLVLGRLSEGNDSIHLNQASIFSLPSFSLLTFNVS